MKDLPIPLLEEDEALVEVKACGLCHHDLLVMAGVLRRGVRLPLVMGHEIAGQVVEVGRAVSNVVPGDRVVCLPADACGHCERCLQGQEHHCLYRRGFGHNINGGMAQYIATRSFSLLKVPTHIPWVEASLLACPIGVGLQALKDVAVVEAGEVVLITGASGGLGIHLVQLARLQGARVLALTSSEDRAALLRKLVSSEIIVNGELDFSEIILALTEDRGADVVADTVGSPLFPGTLRSLAPAGRIVALGEVLGHDIGLNLAELVFRSCTIMGSRGVSKRRVEESMDLVSSGQLRPIISHVISWQEAINVYQLLQERRSPGRIVLQIDDSP